MAFRVRTAGDLDEYRATVAVIGHYFGWEPTLEEVERFSRILPPERLHGVLDGPAIVGGAGVLPCELTVPGGPAACAGVTVVGVLPSHRRRGLLSRSLDDRPERRRGAGPLNRALLELDGRPVGYALYRIKQEASGSEEWRKTVRVLDAFGVDVRATREIWRFLPEIDWTDEVEAWMLPVDHPLQLYTARVNELHAKVFDGLWLRLVDVDVGAALAARSYAADGRVTIEVVSDPLFPDNVATWTIEGGAVRRSSRRPDVRLDVQALATVYLGGFSFVQLARGERVTEITRGGLARADALFATPVAPWCPENF